MKTNNDLNLIKNYSKTGIPHAIHYCWVGDAEIPKHDLEFISTFEINNMPIFKWVPTEEELNHIWIKTCLENKAYAYANDLFRLMVLYEYGGIYCDTDDRWVKPLPLEMLDTDFLIGYETNNVILGWGFWAVPPKSRYIKDLVDWFKDREYNLNWLNSYPIELETIDKKIVKIGGGFSFPKIGSKYIMPFIQKGLIKPYPNEYFLAGHPGVYGVDHNYGITNNTIVQHMYDGSWLKKKFTLKDMGFHY